MRLLAAPPVTLLSLLRRGPRLHNAEARLTNAIHPETYRISRVHELRRYDAPGHDNHTPGEPLATLRQHVSEPHESIKRMAHDIPAIPLTNDGIVDDHRAMCGCEVNSPPVCGGRTENDTAIPGIVSDNGEDLGGKLRIVGVPIIDQLKGCHHGANGRRDLVATIGSRRDWEIRLQAHGDFTLDAQTPIVGAAYEARRLLHRLGQNGATDGLMETNHLLHDRRGQRNLVPSDGAMGGRHARVERFLYGVRFVHGARGTRGWKRAKGLMGAMLLKQELGCLYNSIVIRHHVPPERMRGCNASTSGPCNLDAEAKAVCLLTGTNGPLGCAQLPWLPRQNAVYGTTEHGKFQRR